MGFFAAQRKAFFAEGADGQLLTIRGSIIPARNRFCVVLPEARARVERRTTIAVALFPVVLAASLALTDMSLVAIVPTVAAGALINIWRTWGLPDAPPDVVLAHTAATAQREREFFLNVGRRPLQLLLAASIVMAALQAFVAITDGVWWAWGGLLLFLLVARSTWRGLELVASSRRPAPWIDRLS